MVTGISLGSEVAKMTTLSLKPAVASGKISKGWYISPFSGLEYL